MPQTGSYLGELTNELDPDDKQGLSRTVLKPQKISVLKAKGVTLHSANAQVVP